MSRPIVALLTDFGSRDHYVGAVKGAVLAACPDALLVDVVHDLPPHDVLEGAYALEAAYRAFPAPTVFVAVVDPGVGSERRALGIGAGGYRFVGPDNGIFTFVLAADPQARVHALTNAGLFRHQVSATFHARDVFAPVAGHLARGLPLEELGPALEHPVLLPTPSLKRVGREWETSVLHVDRFGNLTTHLRSEELSRIMEKVGGDPTQLVLVVEGFVLPLVGTYAEVPEGDACGLVGSNGRLEVAVNRGSAARLLGAGKGAPVRVRLVPSEP
jgi:S-adenosyl-L-methionine hydrolase (adenosine-forming)